MKFDPKNHHRRSMRLKGYDYASPGAYFVTMVTYLREQIFGEVVNGKMKCTALGEIVREEWVRSIGIRKEIQLFEDEFVVMPNHVHAIVWMVEKDGNMQVGADGVCLDMGNANTKKSASLKRGANLAPQPGTPQRFIRRPGSLGSFIAGYKAAVTSRAGRELNMTGIWQRNYYDHIIRNEVDYERIYAYMEVNPINWKDDDENPGRRRAPQPV